jgi:hypothetical protein
MVHLIVAHPGHELLLHGWISRNKPLVHILTDGAADSSMTRLGGTAELLRDLGARSGAIFDRLSDREAYGDAPPLYERYGEEQVAAHRHTKVIRRSEHVLPLRDALRAEVEKRSCAF